MKIGFDAKRFFNNQTGLGNYSRSMLRNLLNYHPSQEYHLYSPKANLQEYIEEFSKVNNVKIHIPKPFIAAYWRSYGITKDIVRDNIDIYHGVSHELPRNIHQVDCVTVITIHDLIFKTHPEYFPFVDRIFYDKKCAHGLYVADRIIAISKNTKRDIIKYYNVEPSKIEVIYNSIDTKFYHDYKKDVKLELPERYCLSVGSIEPRKNYDTLIKAYASIPKTERINLIIVGRGKADYVKKISALIISIGLEDSIQIRSDINNSQIVEVISEAEFLIYPSYYEGHGLPISEALLCNTPVIASETSSMQEAGGPDSIYISPNKPDELTDAIRMLQGDESLQKIMATKGNSYARKTFDNQSLTNQLTNLYISII